MANEFGAAFSGAAGVAPVANSPAGGHTQPGALARNYDAAGANFPKAAGPALYYLWRVPNAVALATGLSFSLCVTDDLNNPPSAAGLVTKWGITVTPVTSGTTQLDDTAFASSTEGVVSVTMAATVGLPVVASLAIVIANMNSLAAGSLAFMRLRRLGTAAADTHDGRAVLLNLDARNT